MRLLGFLLLLVAATAAAEPLGSIVGLIKTDQGRPAANVTVSTMGGDVYTLTGTDGRFVLAGIPVGGQKIRIHAEGRTDFELPVPVSEGENMVGTITLQPEMPTIHGDGGQVVAKRVAPRQLFALGVDCIGSAADSMRFRTVTRVDSTRAWATCWADLADMPITFGWGPTAPLRRLDLSVIDDQGRLVRKLRNGRAGTVAGVRTWDGLDEAGRAVPAGGYRVRFATDRDSLEIEFCRREIAPAPPRQPIRFHPPSPVDVPPPATSPNKRSL